MKKLFEKIINSGTEFEKNSIDIRNVRFLNILYLMAIGSAELFNVVYAIIDIKLMLTPILITNVFVLIYAFGIYLNKINKINYSRLLFCLSLTGVTYIMTFYVFGKASYIHFYFLLFGIVPILVWRLKQSYQVVILFLLNLSLYIYVQFYWTPVDLMVIFPERYTTLISAFTVSATFFSILMALWINLSHIEENEKRLASQSEKLEEMLEDINLKHNEIKEQADELDLFNVELSKMNKTLVELNSTKDKFFSIIAHDLKNPLGNFKDVTKLLFEEYNNFSEQERYEFLELMKNSANNIYSLLENLLEWSRSQRGNIPFNPVVFNLKMLIDDIIKLMIPVAEKKNIQLLIHINESTNINADFNMMNTIIRNLVSNAIKFTLENGKIEIGTKSLKYDNEINTKYIDIYIKDSGLGMSPDTIQKLFRIDTQITTLGTNQEKGTGLGLILCKEFVEKHNGNIKVESELGKGSTFIVELPC